jgi:uncharacterized protein (DUF362 family)
MNNIVGVLRGTEKLKTFDELLKITEFDDVLLDVYETSKKKKDEFKIVIKPNMMVYISHEKHEAVVTDKELVEYLVDHIRAMGFEDIAVCEAQNDVGRMLKNHNVNFVANKIGYKPEGRYKIVDLTLESETYKYEYIDKNGKIKIWKDVVGRTWRDADFRITFAKCKTHEHDWMTLGAKNVYGCFPNPNKVCRYHIRYEVFDVTAYSIRNFPIHFSFIDAWIGSDGFQGYKIPNPQDLKMLFGGKDVVAVDMEVFKRAGLDTHKSKILQKTVAQINKGNFPSYVVEGDKDIMFNQITDWENVSEKIVSGIDILEEIYIAWGIINLTPASVVIDYKMFPPKNIIYRIAVWFMKKLYGIVKHFKFFKNLYRRRKSSDERSGVNSKFKASSEELQQMEDGDFSTIDILKIIWASVKKFKDKTSIILWSSFILLMLWGFHGDMAILTSLFGEKWTHKIIFGLPWGEQLASFLVGFILVVVIPCLIIKFKFKEKIRDYGLGLPAKDQKRKSLVVFLSLLGITSFFIFIASFDKTMQLEYPLFVQREGDIVIWTMSSWLEFFVYEIIYLLFFVTIEFAFRGYLLFGLHSIRISKSNENQQMTPALRFGFYAILIQMLAYTTWHYGKPVPEMVGTIIWGISVAAIALRIKSIWPIIFSHWLYNMFLDLLNWKELNKKIIDIF